MEIIDGKKIAAELNAELKQKIDDLRARDKKIPGLVAILVGNDPASSIYVKNKAKSCNAVGLNSHVELLAGDVSESALLDVVKFYNESNDFHGILVQLPLPKHIDENKIINAINPKKDVDGFHPISVGNLVIGNDALFPCTPSGIQEMLKRTGIDTNGKHVVVVGRSNIVGKPIANIMVQKNKFANSIVTICHSASKNISQFTLTADILIAAIGQAQFITADMVKDGAVVIDVGINRIDDISSPKGYRVVGDVDFLRVSEKCSYITPVPGGVGPMTIAMLLQNTYKAYLNIGN